MVFSLGLASQWAETPIYSRSSASVTVHFTDGVATLSGNCLHVEHEVVVCYQKH
jgi:hypothetical protein